MLAFSSESGARIFFRFCVVEIDRPPDKRVLSKMVRNGWPLARPADCATCVTISTHSDAKFSSFKPTAHT